MMSYVLRVLLHSAILRVLLYNNTYYITRAYVQHLTCTTVQHHLFLLTHLWCLTTYTMRLACIRLVLLVYACYTVNIIPVGGGLTSLGLTWLRMSRLHFTDKAEQCL